MATNINLSSSEEIEKKSMTGKTALVASALILVIVFGAQGAIMFLKSQTAGRQQTVESEITAEQAKLRNPDYSDMTDFQARLDLADKAVVDHGYWNNLLVKMSPYLIPEVRLTRFSGKMEAGGDAAVEIGGVAASLDALSRELLLLKTFPELNSLEFKGATAVAEEGRSGINFNASLKIKKSALNK